LAQALAVALLAAIAPLSRRAAFEVAELLLGAKR
jgi:hypothetical protein